MKVKKCVQEVCEWSFQKYGKFEATFWDGKITDVRFYRSGSTGEGLWAVHGSEDFLKCVHKALGELLKKVEVER